MAARVALLLVLGGQLQLAAADTSSVIKSSVIADAAMGANPIRRVVDMLQMMQKKVTAEGEKEKELYDKFMCYCKTGGEDLTASISAAEAKVGQVTSSIEEAEAAKTQLAADLKKHQEDRSEAQDAVSKATALREKEHASYSKESSDLKTNIAALKKAIAAIDKGMGGSFLQTVEAATLRHLTIDMEMSNVDREMLTSFLSSGSNEGYVPKSGEISGILKQMLDTMEKDLTGVEEAETSAVADFEALIAAKNKEITANTKAIESKTERLGQVSVEIVNMKEDLDDTGKVLLEDKAFLKDMDKSCATKKAEWEERSKTRSDELVALAETIKILNDDDALELFKKTLPSSSLLQTKNSGKAMRQQALNVLHTVRGKGHQGDSRLDLITMALVGKSGDFSSVIKMIDEMVEVLGKEQQDDDHKKEYCEMQLDKTEDSSKVLEQSIEDLEKAIDEATGSIATLKEELATLVKEVKKLDKDVTQAMETRKAEHDEFVSTMAANNAAKDLIAIAKNRLAKFYTPKLYKAPPKRELSAEDRIAVNMGGEAPPTEAPGGIAGTGVTYLQEFAPSFAQISRHTVQSVAKKEAPAPPPETWDAYTTKSQEHSGVTAMLDMLVADLDKEIQEMEVDEKDSQAEYEKFTEDSAASRAAKSKAIAEKEGAKADLEMEVQKMTGEHKSTVKEAMAKAAYLKDLHLECDWLMANYEARKEARAGEVDSLKRAKAVLSGADFAFLQTKLADASKPKLLRGQKRI